MDNSLWGSDIPFTAESRGRQIRKRWQEWYLNQLSSSPAGLAPLVANYAIQG